MDYSGRPSLELRAGHLTDCLSSPTSWRRLWRRHPGCHLLGDGLDAEMALLIATKDAR
jgi:hypothetical protein